MPTMIFRSSGKPPRAASNPAGLDCAGLVIAAHKDIYNRHVSVAPYQRRATITELLSGLSLALVRVDRSLMATDDVLVFALDGAATAHCGIFDAGASTLIHAHASERNVVERELSAFWRDKITAVFRCP